MTRVFVTGASGFIAKHVVRELFDRGYAVRASIRSEARRGELQALFPGKDLEFAFLDLTKDEGWTEAMVGCDVLMHTASPFPLAEPKDPQELIRPAVDGTLRAMTAALAAGIKRVILTSSCAAIYKDASKPKDAPSDERNWTTPENPSVGAYEASKTLAEKAAWDFVAQHPDMVLTTINPGAVFGPSMDARYGSSLDLIEQLMSGAMPVAPPISLVLVDVRDVAMMHAAAIDLEAAKGERFAAVSRTLPFLAIARILKDWDPNLKTPTRELPKWLVRLMGPFVRDLKPVLTNMGRNLAVSGAKAEKTFGFQYVSIEEAVVESAKSIQSFKR